MVDLLVKAKWAGCALLELDGKPEDVWPSSPNCVGRGKPHRQGFRVNLQDGTGFARKLTYEQSSSIRKLFRFSRNRRVCRRHRGRPDS